MDLTSLNIMSFSLSVSARRPRSIFDVWSEEVGEAGWEG
jgi:hypothetical protein